MFSSFWFELAECSNGKIRKKRILWWPHNYHDVCSLAPQLGAWMPQVVTRETGLLSWTLHKYTRLVYSELFNLTFLFFIVFLFLEWVRTHKQEFFRLEVCHYELNCILMSWVCAVHSSSSDWKLFFIVWKKNLYKMENCCVTPNLSKMTRWDGDI